MSNRVLFAIGAACSALFMLLAWHVHSGGFLTSVDTALANELHNTVSVGRIMFFRYVTQLGMQGVTLIGVLGAIRLLFLKDWSRAAGWIVAFVGVFMLNSLLKLLFDRPRPVFDQPFVTELFSSFPSGHAMSVVLGWGMLLWLVYMLTKQRTLRDLAAVGVFMVILLVGISRMILGAHYLTDVLGGWLAGSAWLCLCLGWMHSRSHAVTGIELPITESSVLP